jgi:hypothetical protein
VEWRVKVIPTTGTIKAVVRDDAGNYLRDARVYLDGSYKGKTDSSGTLYIRDVGAGLHTVKASKPGYEEDSKAVTVRADRTETVYLTLLVPTKPLLPGKVRIEVVAKDLSGNPVEGATVWVDDHKLKKWAIIGIGPDLKTNRDGVVEFEIDPRFHGINPQDHTLQLKKDGYYGKLLNVDLSYDHSVLYYLVATVDVSLKLVPKVSVIGGNSNHFTLEIPTNMYLIIYRGEEHIGFKQSRLPLYNAVNVQLQREVEYRVLITIDTYGLDILPGRQTIDFSLMSYDNSMKLEIELYQKYWTVYKVSGPWWNRRRERYAVGLWE